MGSELRIGVIGVGGRGAVARHAHNPQDNVRLVAGADIREEPLSAFVASYGPDVFTTDDYREILAREDVDAVFVATPDHFHEEHAVAALEAGKAVYLEKPMAITIEGCDRILRTAQEQNGKLFLGHNMRHMSFVVQMKRLVGSGAIGEPKAAWCRHFVGYGGDAFFKDWHSERKNTTGLLLQKASHDIDVLHWLCSGYAQRVNAMGALTLYGQVTDRRDEDDCGDATFRNENWPPLAQTNLSPTIDVEDLSMLQMQLDNGVFAAYQQCHYTPDAWRNYTVIGTEGRIENMGDDPPNMCIRLWNRRTGYNAYGDQQWFIPAALGTHGGADPRIVAEFVRYVREGGPTTTSPVASRYSVATGCMATRSLRNSGAALEIPPLDGTVAAYFENEGTLVPD
ncbi:MAG: Gfo/Idh/MocA family oxidoreductase [Nitrospiraceae bacterium]|nr:Gfo/Idh/MocA family oxidoreductase [Nitrospiraceae bacterium]